MGRGPRGGDSGGRGTDEPQTEYAPEEPPDHDWGRIDRRDILIIYMEVDYEGLGEDAQPQAGGLLKFSHRLQLFQLNSGTRLFQPDCEKALQHLDEIMLRCPLARMQQASTSGEEQRCLDPHPSALLAASSKQRQLVHNYADEKVASLNLVPDTSQPALAAAATASGNPQAAATSTHIPPSAGQQQQQPPPPLAKPELAEPYQESVQLLQRAGVALQRVQGLQQEKEDIQRQLAAKERELDDAEQAAEQLLQQSLVAQQRA